MDPQQAEDEEDEDEDEESDEYQESESEESSDEYTEDEEFDEDEDEDYEDEESEDEGKDWDELEREAKEGAPRRPSARKVGPVCIDTHAVPVRQSLLPPHRGHEEARPLRRGRPARQKEEVERLRVSVVF